MVRQGPLVGAGQETRKRQDERVSYPTPPHPTVVIDSRPFSVLDLAENGMRFSIDRGVRLKKHVSGRISLLSGKTFSFRGTLARRLGNEAIVKFSAPADYALLVDEGRMLESAQQPAKGASTK